MLFFMAAAGAGSLERMTDVTQVEQPDRRRVIAVEYRLAPDIFSFGLSDASPRYEIMLTRNPRPLAWNPQRVGQRRVTAGGKSGGVRGRSSGTQAIRPSLFQLLLCPPGGLAFHRPIRALAEGSLWIAKPCARAGSYVPRAARNCQSMLSPLRAEEFGACRQP